MKLAINTDTQVTELARIDVLEECLMVSVVKNFPLALSTEAMVMKRLSAKGTRTTLSRHAGLFPLQVFPTPHRFVELQCRYIFIAYENKLEFRSLHELYATALINSARAC